jgi:LemA protein
MNISPETLGIVSAVLIVGLIAYAVSFYNSIVEVRNNADKAWQNIDVILEQRHDELTGLIEICRGYMKYERELLEKIARLRSGYSKAGTPEDKVNFENQLNRDVLRLQSTWEAYPELKASQRFEYIMKRLSALESGIADRREFFNDSVTIYNIQVESFPGNLFSKLFGFRRRKMLEVPAAAKAEVETRL